MFIRTHYSWLLKYRYSNHEPLTINHSQSSFTLIEVMVVVGIIAILVAMLFPAVIGARNRARKKQAMVEACNVALALKVYWREYGKWPNQTDAAADHTYVTNNFQVVNILTIPTSNQRNRIYLSIQANSLDNAGNYVDPWGVPYIICMDENGDNNLSISFGDSYSNQFTGVVTNFGYTNTLETVAGIGVASFANMNDPGTNIIGSWSEIP